MKTKRFLVLPGWVKSQNDGDLHFITFDQLCWLYGVDAAECVNADSIGQMKRANTGLYRLEPRRDGQYDLGKLPHSPVF